MHAAILDETKNFGYHERAMFTESQSQCIVSECWFIFKKIDYILKSVVFLFVCFF